MPRRGRCRAPTRPLSHRRGGSTNPTHPAEISRLLDEAEEHDRLGRYTQAAAVLDAAIPAARLGTASPEILVRALTVRAGLLRYEGRLSAARDLLDEAARTRDVSGGVGLAASCALEVERGRFHLESSEPDIAQDHLQTAASIARTMGAGIGRDLAMVGMLAALAAALRLRGDYAEGKRLLDEAIGLAERAALTETPDGRASLELAHLYDELGILYKFSGEYEASESSYRRALDLLLAAAGPGHPDVASIEHNLGGLAHARGDGATAEPHARRAVELHERSLGPDHLATVLDRAALAAILDQLGRPAEAEALLIDVAERLERTVGPDHREFAVALNNLAAIAQRDGRLDEAERLYRRTIEIKERAIGSDAPSLAITLNNLAGVHRRQGRLDEAANLYRRALNILVTSAGADHPHVRLIERNLARVEATIRTVSDV